MIVRALVFVFACFAGPVFAQDTLTTSILPDAPCHWKTPCPLGDRSYHVKEPDGWDGVTPLPVMLHFHGWARQGDLVVNHARISGATRRAGVLLLAPNGVNKTWNFRQGRSADVDFAAAVLEDAATRYPIDRSRIYVSGYSFGSAMAWRYVCENGNDVAALIAVSGTLRQDEVCPQAPRTVRHVHGLRDTVMDFPMGPGGDTTYPVALWREKFACGDRLRGEDWTGPDGRAYERFVWSGCANGGPVTFDLHPGGHLIPRGYFAKQLQELLSEEPA